MSVPDELIGICNFQLFRLTICPGRRGEAVVVVVLVDVDVDVEVDVLVDVDEVVVLVDVVVVLVDVVVEVEVVVVAGVVATIEQLSAKMIAPFDDVRLFEYTIALSAVPDFAMVQVVATFVHALVVNFVLVESRY